MRSEKDREISASNVKYLRDEITADEHRAEVAEIVARHASRRADLVAELEEPGDVTTASRDTAEEIAAADELRRQTSDAVTALQLDLRDARRPSALELVRILRDRNESGYAGSPEPFELRPMLAAIAETLEELDRIARSETVAAELEKARSREHRKAERLAARRGLDRTPAEMAASQSARDLGDALELIRRVHPSRLAILRALAS